MEWRVRKGCLILLVLVLAITATALALIYYQAEQTPSGRPEYVALGSSFAAGAGLGDLQPDSPLMCARSIGGYPPRLAKLLKIPSVDMSCGGAVTTHLLSGGQFFQGRQLRVIGPITELVTITVGGNDAGYVGDLSMLAARNSGSLFGWGVRQFWSGPKSTAQRDFPGLERTLVALVTTIRARAPKARVVIATYPTIVPASGTCTSIGLSEAEAAAMRQAGDQLAAATRAAARKGGAIVVDMHTLGAKHDACSVTPWVRGWANGGIAPFHPTAAGAQATAEAIARTLTRSNSPRRP